MGNPSREECSTHPAGAYVTYLSHDTLLLLIRVAMAANDSSMLCVAMDGLLFSNASNFSCHMAAIECRIK